MVSSLWVNFQQDLKEVLASTARASNVPKSELNSFLAANELRHKIYIHMMEDFEKAQQPARDALLQTISSGSYRNREDNKKADASRVI